MKPFIDKNNFIHYIAKSLYIYLLLFYMENNELLEESWVKNILNDVSVGDELAGNIVDVWEPEPEPEREPEPEPDLEPDLEPEPEPDKEGDILIKSYPKSVHLFFIYISNESIIEKVASEKIDLEADGILKKELLLYLIQCKKKSKYKLFEVLLFQLLLDDIEKIDTKLKNVGDGLGVGSLRVVPTVKPVIMAEQITLLHSSNAIYILLKEIDKLESEVVNGRKIFKKVPYKKYTRKIKYLGTGVPSNVAIVSNNTQNKTRKNVSFDV